jgi:hypothetical protein
LEACHWHEGGICWPAAPHFFLPVYAVIPNEVRDLPATCYPSLPRYIATSSHRYFFFVSLV